MISQRDVAAARSAVSDLRRAAEALHRQVGNTVDVRRLRADVDRVGEDLDLLAGPEAHATPVERVTIPDDDYPPEFWADAGDEGIGRR